MESRRTRAKANQHHQDSDGPMTSTVKKVNTTFLASREPFQTSKSTSPIPHTSRLSFAQNSDPKIRKATKYILLICEAIEAVGDEKKGASVQTIKKWILGNNPEIPERLFKTSIKNALTQGLEEGTLARPAKSKFTIGAVGFYCVAKKDGKKKAGETKKDDKKGETKKDDKKKTGKAPKVKATKQPEAYASDTELTINRGRAMSLRLNLSDTELAEVRKSLAFEAKPKGRGGKSVKKVAADSADENSSTDSEQEEQTEPVVKEQPKKVAKAPKKTAPPKPPRKAATSKTKEEKNAPPKPKRDTKNKKNTKEKDSATKTKKAV